MKPRPVGCWPPPMTPLDEPVDQIEAQGRTRVPTRGSQVGDRRAPRRRPGSWDWAVPPSNHRYLHGRLSHSELDLVDAGHFTWEDAADQDAEIVAGWWTGGHRRA
jgi:pimeloyl-ACP methyl ester carboxylesterase